jgi:hypothetical protein
MRKENDRAKAWRGMKVFMETMQPLKLPYIFGIDWAAGHGMIRGEVIERRGNVVFVRFKTVTV